MSVTELFPGTSDKVRETEVVPVEDVLRAAAEAQLVSCVMIGRTMDGSLYIASSHDADKAIALLVRATADLATAVDMGTFEEPFLA